MLGPFTFTFTFESEEFEKFGKVGCAALRCAALLLRISIRP